LAQVWVVTGLRKVSDMFISSSRLLGFLWLG